MVPVKAVMWSTGSTSLLKLSSVARAEGHAATCLRKSARPVATGPRARSGPVHAQAVLVAADPRQPAKQKQQPLQQARSSSVQQQTQQIQAPGASTTSHVVTRFVEALNDRDGGHLRNLLSDSCVYHNLTLQREWRGGEAVTDFCMQTVTSFPDDAVLVVDQLTAGDPHHAGSTWHLEVGGITIPMSQGVSFYQLDPATGKITRITDSPEQAVRMALPLLSAASPLLRSTVPALLPTIQTLAATLPAPSSPRAPPSPPSPGALRTASFAASATALPFPPLLAPFPDLRNFLPGPLADAVETLVPPSSPPAPRAPTTQQPARPPAVTRKRATAARTPAAPAAFHLSDLPANVLSVQATPDGATAVIVPMAAPKMTQDASYPHNPLPTVALSPVSASATTRLTTSSSAQHTATTTTTTTPPPKKVTTPSASIPMRPLPFTNPATGAPLDPPTPTPDPTPTPNLPQTPNLSGLWIKDPARSQTAAYEAALDLLGVSGIQKVTARLIEGVDISHTPEKFVVSFVTVVPFFRVSEEVVFGGTSQLSRRDLRGGRQTATAKEVEAGVRVVAEWGEPYAGSNEEVYTLNEAGELEVRTTLRVGGRAVSVVQVYVRGGGDKDAFLRESRAKHGSMAQVLQRQREQYGS